MLENPLVSCSVITYNSAKTVIETLESIKDQTYPNIELIISDDCSTDNTVEICREWLECNRTRFVRTELLTVEKNTGVTGNANRASFACRGVWQKGIAADDKMLPNCIADFIDFVNNNPEACMISSYMRIYNENFDETNCIGRKSVSFRSFFDLSTSEQLKKMACWNKVMAPSLFIKRELKTKLGGYDGRYSFEDYPFFLKALERGYRFYFMDKETVCYRVHQSISHSANQLFNYSFMKESKRFHEECCYKYLSPWQRFGQSLVWKMQSLIVKLNLNKKTKTMEWFYRVYLKVINTTFGLN